MSKKLASGSDSIVLDVKCGDGAFMDTAEKAEQLGNMMVEIGNADGKKTIAVITDMEQPLGKAVGNSLEVIEAIETLKGNGPEDITELSLELAGMMIFAGRKAASHEEGRTLAEEALNSGAGLAKMKAFIEGQGGDPAVIDDYKLFGSAEFTIDVFAEEDGYVKTLLAKQVGLASQHAGAGRASKEDTIDMTAGIYLDKKVGDIVAAGDKPATVYGNDKGKVESAAEELAKAYVIGDDRPERNRLIHKVIGL